MCLVSFAVDCDAALLAGHITLDIKFIGLKWRDLHSCHGRSFTHIRQWHGMMLLHESKRCKMLSQEVRRTSQPSIKEELCSKSEA